MFKILFSLLLALGCVAEGNGAVKQANNPAKQANSAVKQNECTLSIIKPDAVEKNHVGEIIARFEKAGLHVAAIKMVQLTKSEAMQFYAVHKDRPFYSSLVNFMSSSPVIIMVLEGENAVALNREIMGATDPAKAASGTIRADYASSVERNAVHGSDSLENAKKEINFFFKPQDFYKRNSAPK